MGQGLREGVTSLAIDIAGQEAGLDPLLTSLASRTITGAIEGAYSKQGMFQGIANAYTNSAERLFTMGGVGDNPVARATYLAKINDFSQTIQQHGLATALETYATSIFQRDAVESIWRQGGITDFITSRAQVVDDGTGTFVKRIYVGNSTTITVSLDEKKLLALEQNGVVQKGTFKIDPTTGAFGLVDGTVDFTDALGNKIHLEVKDGSLPSFYVKENSGLWLSFKATAGTNGVFKNGYFSSGVLEDEVHRVRFFFMNGSLVRLENLDTGSSEPFDSLSKLNTLKENVLGVFSGGIGNDQTQTSAQNVVDTSKLIIEQLRAQGKQVYSVDTRVFTNQGQAVIGPALGVLQVAGEAFLPISINKEDFKNDLRKALMALTPEQRATVKLNGYFYSGSGQTALEGINELANEEGLIFTFQNVVLIGSPHLITPTMNAVNIINLHRFRGSEDPLAGIHLNFNPNFHPIIHTRDFSGFKHSGEDGYFSVKNRGIIAQAILDAWQTE